MPRPSCAFHQSIFNFGVSSRLWLRTINFASTFPRDDEPPWFFVSFINSIFQWDGSIFMPRLKSFWVRSVLPSQVLIA